MKFDKLVRDPAATQPWFKTRSGRDPLGNTEVAVLTKWFGFMVNLEDKHTVDDHWWFLDVWDREEPRREPPFIDPVAVYCKGWVKQVELPPTREELSGRLARPHVIHDDHPRLQGVVVRDISVV